MTEALLDDATLDQAKGLLRTIRSTGHECAVDLIRRECGPRRLPDACPKEGP